MSAHTPGPWSRVKPLGSAYWTLGRISDHRAEPLPRMNEDADWTLAEAAPDLLEALVWLTNTSCDVGKSGEPPTMNEHIEAIESAKAAIAKAEGKS